MCGRFAQTHRALNAAANLFGIDALSCSGNGSSTTSTSTSNFKNTNTTPQHHDHTTSNQDGKLTTSDASLDEQKSKWTDNYNLSPGMDAIVFWVDDNGKIVADRKVWGLVPRGGTKDSPLPTGMSQHFSNLMFNARSDTLYEKPTFSRLISQGKTCIVAVDGFFEWKKDPLPGKGGKKQPIFVHSKNYPSNDRDENDTSDVNNHIQSSIPNCLLLAGLWTTVSTGRKIDPWLDTFTILTTEVCDPLKWLHSRMPVCLWESQQAMKWLHQPKLVFRQIDQDSSHTKAGMFHWHAVTTEMSKASYRCSDSIKPLPKPKTVKSFFAKKTDVVKRIGGKQETAGVVRKEIGHVSRGNSKTPIEGSPATKRVKSIIDRSIVLPASKKKKTSEKKGTIKSFFTPKAKSAK